MTYLLVSDPDQIFDSGLRMKKSEAVRDRRLAEPVCSWCLLSLKAAITALPSACRRHAPLITLPREESQLVP